MKSWLAQAEQLRAEGSFEKTMEFLKSVLHERPSDPLVHYQIAWTHDSLGKESDAAPAYERAISLGLSGEDLEGAYLGLGSTYRCLGDYLNSRRILERGMSEFPDNGALRIFYALTLHNLKNHGKAIQILLQELARTSSDEKIKSYKRALLFYSDRLDEKFD